MCIYVHTHREINFLILFNRTNSIGKVKLQTKYGPTKLINRLLYALRKIFSKSYWINQKSDFIYHFPIDLEHKRMWFRFDLIRFQKYFSVCMCRFSTNKNTPIGQLLKLIKLFHLSQFSGINVTFLCIQGGRQVGY